MQINKKWIYSVIIFSVSFLLYAKTIGFDLSYFDDDDIIFKNSAFFEGSINIQKIFTTDAYLSEDNYPLYRPLQNLSFAIDTQLAGGIHTWMFHLTNVLLFALFGCCLFFLFQRFNISEKMSFIRNSPVCRSPNIYHAGFVDTCSGRFATGIVFNIIHVILHRFCSATEILSTCFFCPVSSFSIVQQGNCRTFTICVFIVFLLFSGKTQN